MNRLLLAILLAAFAAGAPAQKIYKWVMPDGSVRFSDRPQEDGAVAGEQIELHPPAPASAPVESAAASEAVADEEPQQDAAAEDFPGYDSFEITSPTEGAAIRDNGGNISISLALEPKLQPDHVIELFMDGSSIGTGRSTTITMTNVDRGTHTVQASVVDQSGARAITTGAVTFSLLRVAAGG